MFVYILGIKLNFVIWTNLIWKRNVFKHKKRSFKTSTVQNLADGWSLFALLVATEHSSDSYCGLSEESLISKWITFSSLFPLVFLVSYHWDAVSWEYKKVRRLVSKFLSLSSLIYQQCFVLQDRFKQLMSTYPGSSLSLCPVCCSLINVFDLLQYIEYLLFLRSLKLGRVLKCSLTSAE